MPRWFNLMPNQISENLQMSLLIWQFSSIHHQFCLLGGVNLKCQFFFSFCDTVNSFSEYFLNKVWLNWICAIKYMKGVAFPDLTIRDISVNSYNDSFSFMSEFYWGLQIEWKTFACSNFQDFLKECWYLKFNEVFVIIFKNVQF